MTYKFTSYNWLINSPSCRGGSKVNKNSVYNWKKVWNNLWQKVHLHVLFPFKQIFCTLKLRCYYATENSKVTCFAFSYVYLWLSKNNHYWSLHNFRMFLKHLSLVSIVCPWILFPWDDWLIKLFNLTSLSSILLNYWMWCFC